MHVDYRMTSERKRLVWILILIGMFFANLIVVTLFAFQRMTAAPTAVSTPSATTAGKSAR
jgi:hypothetical protein